VRGLRYSTEATHYRDGTFGHLSVLFEVCVYKRFRGGSCNGAEARDRRLDDKFWRKRVKWGDPLDHPHRLHCHIGGGHQFNMAEPLLINVTNSNFRGGVSHQPISTRHSDKHQLSKCSVPGANLIPLPSQKALTRNPLNRLRSLSEGRMRRLTGNAPSRVTKRLCWANFVL